ncbi:PspA/IM30 family protein [Sporolactobacillus shoreicorticis]|uniref:PspA/IM30 family protein n=1 Tax=Sporolactobacillus shoreicorticis TaxID=1923877 RepID=A0ABW5S617_9BACL|nr:PspA/IM30 family protein [Sporolactobacillus shoreicorticis]MCO7128278.1 PspA/IM30 family protein [Sporolactobacillus shoreicorticis]
MSNIFTRLKDSIAADLNDMLDQKEQKNPIAMLNQHLRRCEAEVKRVRQLIDRQYLLKDQFIKEYHEAAEMAEKRKHQADIAERAAETELYTFALKEHEDYTQKSKQLKDAYETTVKQLDHLEQNYAEMKRKLKDMYLKRMELMSRENIANANHRMNAIIQPERAFGQSFSKFEESEMYLEQLEQKVNTNYHQNTIDARIRELERELEKNKTN